MGELIDHAQAMLTAAQRAEERELRTVARLTAALAALSAIAEHPAAPEDVRELALEVLGERCIPQCYLAGRRLMLSERAAKHLSPGGAPVAVVCHPLEDRPGVVEVLCVDAALEMFREER